MKIIGIIIFIVVIVLLIDLFLWLSKRNRNNAQLSSARKRTNSASSNNDYVNPLATTLFGIVLKYAETSNSHGSFSVNREYGNYIAIFDVLSREMLGSEYVEPYKSFNANENSILRKYGSWDGNEVIVNLSLGYSIATSSTVKKSIYENSQSFQKIQDDKDRLTVTF